MGRRLRIGWIGVFTEARNHYLPSLADWEDIELSALCHPDEERLQRLAGSLEVRKTFTQPGVMLRQVELDAVFVTVPADKGLPILEAAVQRRLHVCTTPATLPDLESCRRLAAGAVDAGVCVNVLFPRRYAVLLDELRSELTSRGGPVAQVAIRLHAPPGPLSAAENARLDRVEWLAGVDLLRALGGEVVSFSGMVGRFHGNAFPNSLTAMVSFADGGIGTLSSDRAAGRPLEAVELHADRVTGRTDLVSKAEIWSADSPEPVVRVPPQTDEGPAPWRIVGGYDGAARKFVDALLHGRDLDTEIDHTIRSMELLARIEGLGADEETVDLPLEEG